MKRMLILFIAPLFLIFTSSLQAAEIYTLEPQHTYVQYHINHFGFSYPSGKWFAQGTLELDKTKPQNSKVKASMTIANVNTGIKELDDHLKGKLFFDATQFPTATFVSEKVSMTGKNT